MNALPGARRGGLAHGLTAYAIWGVLPLYFSLVAPSVGPFELLAHRIVWGLLFLALILTAWRRWGAARAVVCDRRKLRLLVLSAFLVGTNWFVFLSGIAAGRVVETSLGYFLTPLVSVALGLIAFRERLRLTARVGLVLSTAGIGYLVFAVGSLPWMALAVAASFGLYGMVRKKAGVDGLVGLAVETLILAPVSLAFLLFQVAAGKGAMVAGNGWGIGLLVFSGALTAVPMIFYGEATRRLKLSTLGFLQYLLPTLQLVQAVTLLGEPFRPEQQVAFALIWSALAIVAAGSVLSGESLRPSAARPWPTPAAVRADWKARLPRWMQPLLTWLMGYPYPGQKPLLGKKPWWIAVLIPAAVLSLGLGLSVVVIEAGGWAWLAIPVAWLMVVNGARTLQVHICHQGIHGALTGHRGTDRAVVEAVSTVLVIQDHDGYQTDHDGVHHPRLASADDPDRRFITEVMNIEPGIDRSTNRWRFLVALLSPRVHATLLVGRLRANFWSGPAYRRLMAVAWAVVVVAILVESERWQAFAVGCVLPMTLLYHASAMCQFLTEHLWFRHRRPGQSAKDHYRSMLLNRHLGDPLPDHGLTGRQWLAGWVVWWARLLLYHLPVRLGVLVADLPVHGSHHLWPLDPRWTNAICAFRERAEESGKLPVEFVGSYGEILDFVLGSFSEAPPEAKESEPAHPAVNPAVAATSGV